MATRYNGPSVEMTKRALPAVKPSSGSLEL